MMCEAIGVTETTKKGNKIGKLRNEPLGILNLLARLKGKLAKLFLYPFSRNQSSGS